MSRTTLMINLSVYIITLNEEKRLAKTLKQAQKVADEIIVVDSGSTDKTLEIAKKHNAKIIHNDWKSYCEQKYFAETQCTNDYVLMLDADEVLSDKLVKEIKTLKKNPTHNAYRIKITDMFPTDTKLSRFANTFNPVRLYNKQYVKMPKDKMNKDRVTVPADMPVGQLQHHIYHYSIISIEDTVKKHNIHSTELQKTLEKENRNFSILRLVTELPYQFCKYYFGKKFVFRGAYGFIMANVIAYFRFLKVAKRIETQMIRKAK